MKNKTKSKVIIILSVLLVITIGTAAFLFTTLKKTNEMKAAMQVEMDANKQTVFVAIADIAKGSVLSCEGENANIIASNIYSGLESNRYLSIDEMGSTAIVDIAAGDPIMKNMAIPLMINHDTREYEVGATMIMVNQENNDVVDVRITYPNGEDYVVLSKKQIMNLIKDNCIYDLFLSEDEILRYVSAMVDAYSITGCRLYTTRYVESNIQNDAIPNYLVRAETIDLIQSDPNIVETAAMTLNRQARENLEQRLAGITEEQLDAINEGFGLVDTAKSSVLVGIKQEEDAAAEATGTDTTEDGQSDTNADGQEGTSSAVGENGGN